jgi:FemAB-related protein (PEP-CTERM system-associated)
LAKLSLVRISDSSKDLWNNYVSANPHAYVYHLWEWGDVLCKTYNLDRWCLAVKENQRIVGVLPIFCIRGLFFADKLVSLPFCEYGGPLLADYLDQSMAENVLTMLMKSVYELAEKLKIDYIELRHPQIPFSNVFSSSGFRVLQRYVTFSLDLTRGEGEIWKGFGGYTRRRAVVRRLKRARKIRAKVEEVGGDNLKHYYTLYLKTQKRRGSPPHSYAFFENLYEGFGAKNLLHMFLAVSKGKPIAGMTVFCLNRKLYCWNSVMDRKYAGSHPTDFLLWHLIRWGIENDFRVIDFGRTRPEDTGVYYFKSRWGGQKTRLKDYVFLSRNTEIPDPLQRKYVLLSRLWSLVPQSLACKVGPYLTSKLGL